MELPLFFVEVPPVIFGLICFLNVFFRIGAGDDVGMDLLLAPEPNEYFSYTRSFHGTHLCQII